MKTFYAGLIVAGLLALTGCNKSTTGGTPGEGGFKLHGPSNITDTKVEHGTSKTVEITVDADKGFKEDITFVITLAPADKGVTAEMEPKTLKASAPRKAELKISASDKAAPGEYTVTVVGKPAKGDENSIGIKVKVPEKK